MKYYTDGSFWTSNTYGFGPSARALTTTGKWDVVNGQLLITNRDFGLWNWGTRRRPEFPAVDNARIVWITDQELAFGFDDEGANIHLTNVFQRVK